MYLFRNKPAGWLRASLLVLCLLEGASWASTDRDLWLYWPFDSNEPYGFIEKDLSGHHRDARLVWARIRYGGGGRYYPGQGLFGGAAGAVDRGNIQSHHTWALPEAWTLSFWLRIPKLQRWDNLVVYEDDQERHVVKLGVDSSQRLFATVSPPGSSSTLLRLPCDQSFVNRWVHVALTYEAGQICLNVDGKRIKKSGRFSAWPQIEGRLHLVALRGQSHHHFSGLFDEVRIYQCALDSARLKLIGDSKNAFYKDLPQEPLLNAGMPQTLRQKNGLARFTLSGSVRESVPVQWDVKHKPDTSQVMIASPNSLETIVTADRVGDYQFSLRSGRSFETVDVVVFPEHDRPAGTPYLRPPGELLQGVDVEPRRVERRDACYGPLPVLAHWTFDHLDEGRVEDESGQGHAFSLTGIPHETIATGRFAGAIRLIPAGTKPASMVMGSFSQLRETFSLAFWFRSERSDNRGTLFSAPGAWQTHSQHNKGGLAPIHTLLHWGKVNVPLDMRAQWHHVVMCYGQGMRKMYLNGLLADTAKADFVELGEEAPPLVFNSNNVHYGFKGLLDDVTLYGCVLNNEEVSVLYEQEMDSRGLHERLPQDPFATIAYRQTFVESYFPELSVDTSASTGRGFAMAKYPDQAPPAYCHPRLFFTLEDLPRIRQNLRGRVGIYRMSEIRQYLEISLPNRLDENGEYRLTASMEEDGDGPPRWKINTPSDATLCAEAFRCLVDADSEGARRLARWLVRTAQLQHQFIDTEPDHAGWQHIWHNVMLRMATPYIYDLIAPWMTAEQCDLVSSAIARSTQGKWSLGMYALPAMNAHLSNWETWVTAEYLLALMAIEGETGFDPEAYGQAMRALKLCSILLADPESGAPYEGMAKNLIAAPVLAAASRRLRPEEKFIAGDMPYHHVRKFFFHATVPWGGWMMMDDLLGGLNPIRSNPPTILHHAYPDDPIVDYVFHSAVSGRDDYGKIYLNTYGFSPEMMAWSFTKDWSGPNDLQEHLTQAVAATQEPLGYVSNYRGLMIGRSDWTPQALQLYFQPRSLIGGHAMCTRGYFRLNALGRRWAPFYGWYNEPSQYHSVVLVDGQGQDTTPGTVLHYEGAGESPGAQVDLMISDLTAPYSQGLARDMSLNDNRWRADVSRPWMDLPRHQLVHWYDGDRPQYGPAVNTGPLYTFDYAYRTAALVRGTHPYVLIVDDLRKDDDEHEFRWSMPLPQDIWEQNLMTVSSNRVVLSDPDGARHLLIQVLYSQQPVRFEIVVHKGGKYKTDDVPKLDVICRSSMPGYRVLLLPFLSTEDLPRIQGNESETLLQWEDGDDRIIWQPHESGRTEVTLIRDGLELISPEP